MNSHKPKWKRPFFVFMVTMMLITTLTTVAFADTDGTEPKITQQPDQLVLQLGARWAGVEFELRTDAGIFPVPVVVDESGVLRMDLGGSTTYTLSCLNSTVPIPDPTVTTDPDVQPQPGQTSPEQDDPAPSQPQPQKTALPLPAIVFFVGLAAAAVGLVALHISKRRREAAYEEWDDDEDEP